MEAGAGCGLTPDVYAHVVALLCWRDVAAVSAVERAGRAGCARRLSALSSRFNSLGVATGRHPTTVPWHPKWRPRFSPLVADASVDGDWSRQTERWCTSFTMLDHFRAYRLHEQRRCTVCDFRFMFHQYASGSSSTNSTALAHVWVCANPLCKRQFQETWAYDVVE